MKVYIRTEGNDREYDVKIGEAIKKPLRNRDTYLIAGAIAVGSALGRKSVWEGIRFGAMSVLAITGYSLLNNIDDFVIDVTNK